MSTELASWLDANGLEPLLPPLVRKQQGSLWDEGKHHRAGDGKFSSGAGGGQHTPEESRRLLNDRVARARMTREEKVAHYNNVRQSEGKSTVPLPSEREKLAAQAAEARGERWKAYVNSGQAKRDQDARAAKERRDRADLRDAKAARKRRDAAADAAYEARQAARRSTGRDGRPLFEVTKPPKPKKPGAHADLHAMPYGDLVQRVQSEFAAHVSGGMSEMDAAKKVGGQYDKALSTHPGRKEWEAANKRSRRR